MKSKIHKFNLNKIKAMRKNNFLKSTLSSLFLLFTVLIFSSQVNANSFVKPVVTSSTVQFSITIPESFSSSIIREETETVVNFNFKKADGTTSFLFSVNKIATADWMNVQAQLVNAKVLDNKNGMIYFLMVTDKQKMKGADSEKYNQVMQNMNSLIASIKITE